MNTVDIPRNRIFHSRDSSFVEDVLRETNGRGVDIVLDSMSGDLLRASWRVVAKLGKMIEIGKRDFLEHGKLDMEMFQYNRSFHGVDLLELSYDKPDIMRQYGPRREQKLVHANPYQDPRKSHGILPAGACAANTTTDHFRRHRSRSSVQAYAEGHTYWKNTG